MGFWDVARRMIQGKPAFVEPVKGSDDWESDEPTTDLAEERQAKREDPVAPGRKGLINEEGIKEIPVVCVVRNRYILSDPYVEFWATIQNQSDRVLHLEQIAVVGQRAQLMYPLQPGQEREFSIYKGKKVTTDSYTKAELYYKDHATGDYFRADHLIEYKFENDSTYTISDMRLLMPINDV